MLVPWRVLHFYHELIFIIPNFMQPKANISSDMQLTLPFSKAQTTSRRKKYTPLASFGPRGGNMFHGISCIEHDFFCLMEFNGSVLVVKQKYFQENDAFTWVFRGA